MSRIYAWVLLPLLSGGCVIGGFTDGARPSTHQATVFVVKGKVEKNDLTRTPVKGAKVTAFLNGETVGMTESGNAGDFVLEVPCDRTRGGNHTQQAITAAMCAERELRLVVAGEGAEESVRIKVPLASVLVVQVR